MLDDVKNTYFPPFKFHFSSLEISNSFQSFYLRKSPVSQGVWELVFFMLLFIFVTAPRFPFGNMCSLSGAITQDAITANNSLIHSPLDRHFSYSRFLLL